jgi:hypothetical protein
MSFGKRAISPSKSVALLVPTPGIEMRCSKAACSSSEASVTLAA